MKIITWNCNMAFRKKAQFILKYKPDILIIQECECPEKLLFPTHTKKPCDTLWFGKNKNKGLGIFSYSDARFTVLEKYNEDLKIIVPVAVTGGQFNFTLLAIWANNPTDKDGKYIEQVWKALKQYDTVLTETKTILAGDFNSNKIWDRKYRLSNHSHVVKLLEDKQIFSCYHLHFKQEQGQETRPTLYLYRHPDKPYHLDYCFISADMMKNLQSVEVGEYDLWRQYSDHMPVIVTIGNKQNRKSLQKIVL